MHWNKNRQKKIYSFIFSPHFIYKYPMCRIFNAVFVHFGCCCCCCQTYSWPSLVSSSLFVGCFYFVCRCKFLHRRALLCVYIVRKFSTLESVFRGCSFYSLLLFFFFHQFSVWLVEVAHWWHICSTFNIIEKGNLCSLNSMFSQSQEN